MGRLVSYPRVFTVAGGRRRYATSSTNRYKIGARLGAAIAGDELHRTIATTTIGGDRGSPGIRSTGNVPVTSHTS